MNHFRFLALPLLLAAWTAQAQINGVTAELQLPQDQYLPSEDIQLRVQILNRSGQEITLGQDNNWISLAIVDEKNVACAKRGQTPAQGEFSLMSGEVGAKLLNPAPYFDFPRPGRYKVSATIRIPQWRQEISCKPVYFTIANGVPLPNLANLQIGIPPGDGEKNPDPEVRRYSLLRISYLRELKLYFRLTDVNGRILRMFPIARMTSFSEPEAQIDKFNNFHVLSQIGARSFTYCVINPEGRWLNRQTYLYTLTRPVLKLDDAGRVFVGGGIRYQSNDDYPPPPPVAANR